MENNNTLAINTNLSGYQTFSVNNDHNDFHINDSRVIKNINNNIKSPHVSESPISKNLNNIIFDINNILENVDHKITSNDIKCVKSNLNKNRIESLSKEKNNTNLLIHQEKQNKTNYNKFINTGKDLKNKTKVKSNSTINKTSENKKINKNLSNASNNSNLSKSNEKMKTNKDNLRKNNNIHHSFSIFIYLF